MPKRGLWVGIALAALLVACAGENPADPQRNSPAARLVDEGDALLAVSDFTGAHTVYLQAIEQDPEYAPAYSRRAFALLFDPAQQDRAIVEARRATELQPNSPEAWAYLARALDWNGDLDGALEAAKRAERLDASDADVQSFLAEVLADLRMFDEALEAGEKAVRLNPQNPEAHRNLAYVYAFVGRREEALAQYEQAHSLEPEFVHRSTSLAALHLFDLDDNVAAQEWLAEAEALAPDDYITRLFRARLESSRGNFDAALESCGRILDRAPNAPAGYNCQGSVLLDAGLYDEAILARQIAIAADPDDYSGYLGLGYALYARGDCELAATQFDRAVELHPRSGGNHAALGFAYTCLDRWDQALDEYQTAIELEPYQGDHYILLARLHLEQGDLEAAKEAVEAAIELNPNNDQYIAWMGRVYGTGGQFIRAIAEYQRAAEMDPDDGSHKLAIGYAILSSGGDPSQAGFYFESAMEKYIEFGARPKELAQASYGLALTHLKAGECAHAIPHLQDAIRTDPSLVAAGEYLAQCRAAAGYQGAPLPTEIVQRGQYAGQTALDALTQGLAVLGIDSRVEFQSTEPGELSMLVVYLGSSEPGTNEFLSQQSLVTFASSLVAARTVVPEVSRLAVITVDQDGETTGALGIRVQDARLWNLGIVSDAGFTSLWQTLQS